MSTPKYAEFRIALPLTVEEYHIAQLYMVVKLSEMKSTGDEGVDVMTNEPYTKDDESGQYTHKMYHLGQSFPGWVKKIAPKDALKMEEKAWNAYPNCKTCLTNPWAKERFHIIISSRHVDGGIDNIDDNVFKLTPEELKNREVVNVNICDDVEAKDYKEEEDPTKWKSAKNGRGALDKDSWQKTNQPMMICYKLVDCKVQLPWPIGKKMEEFIRNFQKNLFLTSHRQLYCWMDEWIDLKIEDIRKMEADLAEKLAKRLEEKKAAEAAASK